MFEGLREAIARTVRKDDDHSAIKTMIDSVRQMHRLAQHHPDPDTARQLLNDAHKIARAVVRPLPLGELRNRLRTGELIPEQDWDRLVGSPPKSQTVVRIND